jgi:hypothetical protein
MADESRDRWDDRKARAKILTKAIDDTVDFLNRHSAQSVTSSSVRSGFLIANGYFLISDAYKRIRGMENSRTHFYKVAAFVVASIMTVRPIRIEKAQNVSSIRAAFANQQCAMRVAQALLGLDLEKIDADFIRRLYSSVFDPIEMPCLHQYISDFEKHIPVSDDVTFESVEQLVPFSRYDVVEFSRAEIESLDSLIAQFTTLEKAYGHPFLRVFLGWIWSR